MEETETKFVEALKNFMGGWPSYVTFAGLVLYVSGYLSLRFHLTVLGVGTDLAVLDERYFLTGVKFLVYLTSTIPSLLMLLVLAIIIVLIPILPFRFLPIKLRAKLQKRFQDVYIKFNNFRPNPITIPLLGLVLSLLSFQLVMRQCFNLDSLLMNEACPNPAWVRELFLDQNEWLLTLYFNGLVAIVLLALILLVVAWRQQKQTFLSKTLISIFAFLTAVQLLSLPVNFGMLVLDKKFAKVASFINQDQDKEAHETWLVWEGKEAMTYFVKRKSVADEHVISNRLITIPKTEIKKTGSLGTAGSATTSCDLKSRRA